MLEKCPEAGTISVLLLGGKVGVWPSGSCSSGVSPARLVGSFFISPIDDVRLEAVQKYEPSYDLRATCCINYVRDTIIACIHYRAI